MHEPLRSFRRALTSLGVVADFAVGAAITMFLVALVCGVHCPQCDRWHLGPRGYAFWSACFTAQDWLFIAGAAAGLLSLTFANRRVYGAAAIALAVLGFLGRPR